MRSFLQDEAAAIPVLFTEAGEPFIPPQGSVTYTLRDHSGQGVSGHEAVPVTTTNTTTEIVIDLPAGVNGISNGRDFEKRSLVVRATRNGKPWQRVLHYRITPWLNHTVTPDSVRALGGFDPSDLSDDEIDVYVAYRTIEQRLGATAFATALMSGTRNETLVNRAIEARCILDAMPALQSRLLKRRTDGSISAERFDFDPKEMKAKMIEFIDEAVGAIVGVDETYATGILVSTIIDPITGV